MYLSIVYRGTCLRIWVWRSEGSWSPYVNTSFCFSRCPSFVHLFLYLTTRWWIYYMQWWPLHVINESDDFIWDNKRHSTLTTPGSWLTHVVCVWRASFLFSAILCLFVFLSIDTSHNACQLKKLLAVNHLVNQLSHYGSLSQTSTIQVLTNPKLVPLCRFSCRALLITTSKTHFITNRVAR